MNYKFLLLLIPIGCSLFYGLRAVRIFGYPEKDQKLPEFNKSWHIHQFWFNFIGSLAGWFLLILSRFILKDIRNTEDIGFMFITVFVTGLLGIVGLLPSLLAQIPNLLRFLTKQTLEDFYQKK